MLRRTLAAASAVLLCCWGAIAHGEVVQRGDVRIALEGAFSPRFLPRYGSAAVSVSLDGKINPTLPEALPQLRRISISVNSRAHLGYRRTPRCGRNEIQPSTSSEALSACRSSLVGKGRFTSDIRLPEQSPFPSQGKILAFNGRYRGRPAILAHIYGTDPTPVSYVLPFTIRRTRGRYGLVLQASLPQLTGDWGYVTGISLALGLGHGNVHSYLTASCPAPSGFREAVFPLMKTSFTFSGSRSLTSTLLRDCSVKA
jgi:hypothetical protein